MEVDKLYRAICKIKLAIHSFDFVYYQYQQGLVDENQLRIAYNEFRAHTGCVCEEK